MVGSYRRIRNRNGEDSTAEWEREHGRSASPASDDAFARHVLPALRGVPLRVMAQATGLSEGYCSFVRRGQKVPDARHRAALAMLEAEHG